MLDFIKEKQDVWQILQLTDKPVVLYGMGNGADQIIDLCDRMQIKVAGIFASDCYCLCLRVACSFKPLSGAEHNA